MLSESQVTQFDRDGFITFDTPLTPQQIDGAIAAFDEELPDKPPTEKFQATRQGSRNALAPELLAIMFDPFFESCAAQLLRAEDVSYFQSSMIVTYPDPNIEKSELDHDHLDTLLCTDDLNAIPRRMSVGFFLWLNDVNEKTAPLYARPGSHRMLADFRQRDEKLRSENARIEGAAFDKIPPLDWPDRRCITAKAGQVTAITTAAIHCASTNAGDWPRRTLVFSFTPRDSPFGLPEKQQKQREAFNPKLRELVPESRRYLIPV